MKRRNPIGYVVYFIDRRIMAKRIFEGDDKPEMIALVLSKKKAMELAETYRESEGGRLDFDVYPVFLGEPIDQYRGWKKVRP